MKKGWFFSTIQTPEMEYKKAKHSHNQLTEQLAEQMKAAGMTDLLIMSAGPYKHHSCMSAYCVDAQEMADAVGMICWGHDGKSAIFRRFCFTKTVAWSNWESHFPGNEYLLELT